MSSADAGVIRSSQSGPQSNWQSVQGASRHCVESYARVPRYVIDSVTVTVIARPDVDTATSRENKHGRPVPDALMRSTSAVISAVAPEDALTCHRAFVNPGGTRQPTVEYS